MATMLHNNAISALLVVGLSVLAGPASGDPLTLLIANGKISDSDPYQDSGQLSGKQVWFGDHTGKRLDARVAGDGETLDWNSGLGPFLGYAVPAEFRMVSGGATTDAQLKEASTTAIRGLGARTGADIEIIALATVDLDRNGTDEIIVQAHTVRDAADPYKGAPGDVEALIVISRGDSTLKVTDMISTSVDPASNNGSRSIVELKALGRPAEGNWQLLIRETSRFIGKPSISFNIEINGEQMAQPDAAHTRITNTTTAVYSYIGEKLVALDNLGSFNSAFCAIEHCED